MKCRIVYESTYGCDHPTKAGQPVLVGTIIDDPQCFRLVQNGHAEPADEECRIRAGLTPEQLADVQIRYPAIAKGITPDDRKAYFDGEMDGYNPDMSPIPGPNAAQNDDEEDDDE